MMRTRALALVIAVAAVSLGAAPRAPRQQPRLVFSCDTASFGPGISAEELAKRFGAENVSEGSIYLGEGESDPGTVLFPADSERRVEIVWKNKPAHRDPSFVRIAGESSLWATRQGITLGTRLRTLEKLNARMFRVAGFGFDGSGAIIGWLGGRLDRGRASCEIKGNLDPIVKDSADHRWYNQVVGDRTFSSGHPAMQQLDPRVERLVLVYSDVPAPVRKPPFGSR